MWNVKHIMPSLARPAVALLMVAVLATVTFAAPPRPGSPAHASPASLASGSPAPTSPLFWTRSYYVANASNHAMRNLGCRDGNTAGRNTLFFGAPARVGSGYGATLWSAANRTTAQVGELVKDYIRGYVWCRQSQAFQLFVGMGTSNSAINGKSDGWVLGHGRAWAATVRAVAAWAARYYPGVARVYGAWDAEPSWSSPHKAEMWMRGYDSQPGRRALHANFSADGCPRNTASNGACNNGWRQEHLWRLGWRYDPSLPMPQIYATSGVNARQWQQIDLYGAVAHGDGMVFWGTLSQLRACRQMGGCRGTDNGPRQAHDQLLWHLNTHPTTRQATIETTSDMSWHR